MTLGKKIDSMEKNLPEISQDLFTFAEYDEKAAELTGYSNYSYWTSTWNVFMKNRIAMFFMVLLIGLMLFTFIRKSISVRKRGFRTGTSLREKNTGSAPIPSARICGPESGAGQEPPCSLAWW